MTDGGRQPLEARMSHAVEAMERDFHTVRTGRASTCAGGADPGGVLRHDRRRSTRSPASAVPEPHQIVIQPWDRGVLGAIEKAIMKSDLGLMPNVDGTVVRLNIPPLTEERRKELVKVVHKRMEEAKVEIRNHRREGADELKKREKAGDIGADETRRELEQVEQLTHHWTEEVDRLGKAKEQEIMEV